MESIFKRIDGPSSLTQNICKFLGNSTVPYLFIGSSIQMFHRINSVSMTNDSCVPLLTTICRAAVDLVHSIV